MLEGIGAVRPLGVHHRHGVGQGVLALVVVRDDQVQADFFGVAGLLHAGDTAVHGDDQGHALLPQGAQGILPQAVAVLDAAGDVFQAVPSAQPQVVHQQHGGGDAVHVVVSEHGHPLAGLQAPPDTGHGLVHVLHQEGRVGQLPLPLQEQGGLLRGLHVTGGQHGGEQAGISRRAQFSGGGLVVISAHPSGVFHGTSLRSQPSTGPADGFKFT